MQVDAAIAALSPVASQDAVIGFSLEYLREGRKVLLDAEVRLTPLVHRPPPPVADLRATMEVPRLHDQERASLVPLIRVPAWTPPEVSETPPPPIPKPRTFEELAAAIAEMQRRNEADREKAEKAENAERAAMKPAPEADEELPPAGFAVELPPVLTPEQFRRSRTRECFEEVAMIGSQRAPLPRRSVALGAHPRAADAAGRSTPSSRWGRRPSRSSSRWCSTRRSRTRRASSASRWSSGA